MARSNFIGYAGFCALLLILGAVLGALGTYRTISSTYDNQAAFIACSDGNYYNATWANIQAAINALNGPGTVYLPAGTISGATTIHIDKNIRIVGAGKASTVLDYTGSGSVIYIDGTTNYINGAGISDLTINANNCTAISLIATAPAVITKSTFERLYISDPLYGIYIYGTTVAEEVYKNTFNDIDIMGVNAPGRGIYLRSGCYNTFSNIEVDVHPKAYALYVTGTGCSFYNIAGNGAIWTAGQNNGWYSTTIEGLYQANAPVAAPNDYAFWQGGADSTINLLTITTTDTTYGLIVYNANQTVINVRGYGSPHPYYTFAPQSSSSGVAISIGGSSTSWTNLNAITTWDFINVNSKNYFKT
jgi:hypothetical protein